MLQSIKCVKVTCQLLTDSIAHSAHIEGVAYTMALNNEQEAIIHCCTYCEQEQVLGITWLGVIMDNINNRFRLMMDFLGLPPTMCHIEGKNGDGKKRCFFKGM